MKYILNRHGIPSLIGTLEIPVYEKINNQGFVPINALSEREQQIARNLYEKDILQKTQKNGTPGYTCHD